MNTLTFLLIVVMAVALAIWLLIATVKVSDWFEKDDSYNKSNKEKTK